MLVLDLDVQCTLYIVEPRDSVFCSNCNTHFYRMKKKIGMLCSNGRPIFEKGNSSGSIASQIESFGRVVLPFSNSPFIYLLASN